MEVLYYRKYSTCVSPDEDSIVEDAEEAEGKSECRGLTLALGTLDDAATRYKVASQVSKTSMMVS